MARPAPIGCSAVIRFAAALLVAMVCTATAGATSAGWGATKLPRPAFPRTAAVKPAPPGAPRLVLVSSRRNAVTDVADWFARNDLMLREYAVPDSFRLGPALPALPARVPTSIPYGDARIVRAIRQQRALLLVYGSDFSDGRYLACAEPASLRFTCGFDLVNFGTAPGTTPGEGGFFQGVVWAAQVGGVLYVANAHRTYASSSHGLNAYLTAIDLKRRRVLWRNGPLLANGTTFEVVGNLVVSGYGFTAEPDFLYLIDRRDGKVIQRLALPSAPEYIVRQGRQIFVRTYDHDVVVELRAG